MPIHPFARPQGRIVELELDSAAAADNQLGDPGRRTVAFACVLHAREEPAAAMTSAKAVAQFLAWWFGS